jgi:microcystin-dependent protein
MAPYIGQIIMFAGTYEPAGWKFCQGQILKITDFQNLFSVIGTAYGGDGKTTFALPQLLGRIPMNYGNGPGLGPHNLGEMGGTGIETITEASVPPHTHTVNATHDKGDTASPAGHLLGKTEEAGGQLSKTYRTAFEQHVDLHPETITHTGENKPHSNQPPYIALNFIIAIGGTLP